MRQLLSYSYESGPTRHPMPCPGLYCGRQYIDGMYSSCGACPWGSRVNSSFVCSPCDADLPMYDWLYLLTMVLATLLLHFYFIDKSVKLVYRSKPSVILLHLCAVIESGFAAATSLLFFKPFGQFVLKACGVHKVSDFYTIFRNPTPNYQEQLYCAQEAVYPLYTIVLCYFGMSVAFLILVRTWLVRLLAEDNSSIYAGLYFLPILAAFHAALAGYVYYSYPVIILISAIVSSAWFLASQPVQYPRELLSHIFLSPRRVMILVGHWVVTVFGVISVSEFVQLEFHPAVLSLVPSPVIFYFLTLKFSDPTKLHDD